MFIQISTATLPKTLWSFVFAHPHIYLSPVCRWVLNLSVSQQADCTLQSSSIIVLHSERLGNRVCAAAAVPPVGFFSNYDPFTTDRQWWWLIEPKARVWWRYWTGAERHKEVRHCPSPANVYIPLQLSDSVCRVDLYDLGCCLKLWKGGPGFKGR